MLDAAENRLLHVPTMRLRLAAAEPDSSELSLEELSIALDELFELNTEVRDSTPAASEGALSSRPRAAAEAEPERPPEHNSRWPNSQ